MKSSLYPVRTAFKAAIETLGYAVYDREPTIQAFPYILIGSQTEEYSGDQDGHGEIATINIEVVNGWTSQYGERVYSDDIVNAILDLIINKQITLVIAGFDMPMLVLDNMMSSTYQSKTQTIVTSVLRFKMWLWEQPAVIADTVTNAILTSDGLNYILTSDGNNYLKIAV